MPNTIITKHSTGVFSVNNGTIQKIDGSFGATTEGTLISIKGRNGQVLYQDITVGGAGDRLLINDLTTTINYDPATTLEAMTTLYAIGFFVEAAVVAAGTFAGLLDTSIVAPANGQLPFYNSATSRWTNRLAVINDITEFNVTAPVINDVLQWNGTDFVNRQSLFINESEAVNFGAVGSLFNSANFVNLDIEQLGGIFRVRSQADTELFSVENTGNAFLREGSLFIPTGGLAVSASIVANGASAINNNFFVDGNVDITADVNLNDNQGVYWDSGSYLVDFEGTFALTSAGELDLSCADGMIFYTPSSFYFQSPNMTLDCTAVEFLGNALFFGGNITGVGKIRVSDSAAAPAAGDIRYNNGAGRHEGYNGVSWNAMY